METTVSLSTYDSICGYTHPGRQSPLRLSPNCSLNSHSIRLPLPARNAVKPEVRLWSQ